MQPGVAFPLKLFDDNVEAIEMAENPLSFSKNKNIDVWWHHVWDLVKTKVITVLHLESRGQRADTLTKMLSISLFKRHRKGLMNLRDGD